ncbi:MAG: L-threonine 3-dehydrogenase [Elusimicrobiaceae bacterium]|nr:L-threonine 3-dehydrogenase [Elusimicrobiaceae bacterium]
MKALVKKYAEPGLWLEQVPEPEISENDVLIKISKTAICGTDAHIYEWNDWAKKTIPVPMHVGHEFVGEVVETGSAVTGIRVGQRVSGEGHVVCGFCRNCRAGARHLCINTKGIGVNRPGAFAEYLAMPAANVFPLGEHITDDIAAILDPLGNAVHTALSFDLIGEDVLVTGAGPIGIMGALIARHVAARNVVITDLNDYRLELAENLGVKTVVDVRNKKLEDVMRGLGMTEGFDVGLEMSGSAVAFNDMLENVRMGGKVALLGLLPDSTRIPWGSVIFKGLLMKAIYGREIFETWYKMSAMLQSGLDVSGIITHHYDVRDYKEAFELMLSGKSGKIILSWQK